MAGNTVYRHRVTVVTTRGEEVPSLPSVGRFHEFITEWPLAVGQDGRVRLYREDDRIAALVATPRSVRLLLFSREGALLEEQVLVDPGMPAIAPETVSMFRQSDGQGMVSLAVGDTLVVALFTADGRQVPEELDLLGNQPVLLPTGYSLQGPVTIEAYPEALPRGVVRPYVTMTDLTVSVRGQTLFRGNYSGAGT